MPRKMVMVTNLDVWLLTEKIRKAGTGNQSLYNTLLGYAGAGWEVHLLTTSRTCEGMPPVHERVFIHRRPVRWVEAYLRAKSWARGLARLLLGPATDMTLEMQAEPGPPSKGFGRYARIFRRVMGRRAIALARRIGPVDLLYGYEILGALAARRAAEALGVSLVTRFQGTELSRFLGDRARMLSYRMRVEALRTPADLVIMANDGTQGDKVLDALGVPRERVRFWMNGVVKDDVYRPGVDAGGVRRGLGIGEGEVFILHTGRMFHWKRIDRHLEVLARAAQEFPRFKAVFIGDGPELPACKALAGRLGLEGRVLFLGALPHGEVMNYLNACDIYVSFYDLSNLSNSLIESCVCGKCVVTTAVGGTTDLLTDGVNGVVVAAHDDVEAIARGLLRVLKDPAERLRLAEGARRRSEELKTWQERMRMEIQEVEKVLAAAALEGRSAGGFNRKERPESDISE
ncbi:MAG: glycosyltransferase family 4 protein [Planctomycetes bacterium]|nr:glycosyltransferase family 4 protein [Planctomycetota bacterium]